MAPDPKIMKAVEQLGYRATVGDIAAQAGLNINFAQQGLLALASDAGGHLQVAQSGEIAYLFPKNFRSILRNKYLLSLACFAIWMLFFDRNDFFVQLERRRNLQEIEESKAYFAQKIAESKRFTHDIQTNAAAIEKFAREKYHMKRENEDLFLIQKPVKQ